MHAPRSTWRHGGSFRRVHLGRAPPPWAPFHIAHRHEGRSRVERSEIVVRITSPVRLIQEALAELVQTLGYRAQLQREPLAHVALRDLCADYRFYPAALPIPTLALLCHDPTKGERLTLQRLGYRGVLDDTSDMYELDAAILALSKHKTWNS